jgi:hypothetical protein
LRRCRASYCSPLAFLPRKQHHQSVRLDPARHVDLFAWVASVAADVGTKAPRHIEISVAWNAMVHRGFTGRHLHLGIPLWMSLTTNERRAVVAHEMGHFVNGDTSRLVAVSTAHLAMFEWERAFVEMRRPAARLLVFPARMATRTILHVFGRLGFVTSQRAEYFADLEAARLASTEAMSSALAMVRVGHVTWELSMQRARLRMRNEGYWAQLTSLIGAVPDDERRRRRRAAELDMRGTPYSSHPSTGQRIAVLNAHPVLASSAVLANMQAIDEALRPTIGTLVEMANKGKTTRRPIREAAPA